MAATLDIVLLRTFVAIDDHGGFGRAADALRISQPTVSQHVRVLEKRLGRPLVEKDGRASRFTGSGVLLLTEARRIIAVHDAALSRLGAMSREPLVIGSVEAAAEIALPELLDLFPGGEASPEVRFRIDRSLVLAAAVQAGSVDIGLILDTSDAGIDVDIDDHTAEIAVVPLRWFARAEHLPSPPIPLVVHPAGSGVRERALQVLDAARIPARIATEAEGRDAVIAAARSGLGVVVLPSLGLAPQGLRPVAGLPDAGHARLRLLWRPGTDQDVLATSVSRLRAAFARSRRG